MMIGAKIMLNTGLDAARDGLADLAGDGWLLGVPGHDVRGGHPAGSARPGSGSGPGGPGAPGVPGPGLIAVAFGALTAPTESSAALPVRWESLEPGDNFTVLLDADITLVPVEPGMAMLTLAGVCRLPRARNAGSHQEARSRVTETARAFMTGVADAVTRCSGSDPEQEVAGPVFSWLSELPGTP